MQEVKPGEIGDHLASSGLNSELRQCLQSQPASTSREDLIETIHFEMFAELDRKIQGRSLTIKDVNSFTLSLYPALEPILKKPFSHAGIKGYLAYLVTYQYLEVNKSILSSEIVDFLKQIEQVLTEVTPELDNNFSAWVSDKFSQLNTVAIRRVSSNGFIKVDYTYEQFEILKQKLRDANLMSRENREDNSLNLTAYLAYVGEPTFRFFLVFDERIIQSLNDGQTIDRSVYTGVSSAHITVTYGGKDGGNTLNLFKQLAEEFDLYDQRKLPVNVQFEHPIRVFKKQFKDLKLINAYEGTTDWWAPVKKVTVIQVHSEELEILKQQLGLKSSVPTHITFRVEQRRPAVLPDINRLHEFLKSCRFSSPYMKRADRIFNNDFKNPSSIRDQALRELPPSINSIDKESCREHTVMTQSIRNASVLTRFGTFAEPSSAPQPQSSESSAQLKNK